MIQEVPEWLPDWRNKEEYPNPKKTPPQQWAWEFLRRNVDYRKEYKELIQISPEVFGQKKHLESLTADKQNSLRESRANFTKKYYGKELHYVIDPKEKIPWDKDFFFLDINRRREGRYVLRGGCLTPQRQEAKDTNEFWNQDMNDPSMLWELCEGASHSFSNMLYFLEENTASSQYYYLSRKVIKSDIAYIGEHSTKISTQPHEAIFTINLDGEINRQLEKIKKIANKLQQNLPKPSSITRANLVSGFIDYLRTYDAILSMGGPQGVVKSEVARELYGEFRYEDPNYKTNLERVTDNFDSAKKLIEGKYLRIAQKLSSKRLPS
ncbi:transcriptional regulator domain-containing protein [Desulfotalea psychrophila]|uniref:Transcriptional regulator-like domain-containing protein n=1 Tax=Desulfotalea psychrophila (strain LSv54 / DSM 12343) TaxID=177439 RepID=Q6APB7_DESPS|nr:DUF6499 domain-containing protein [Desulfotalea psychrophila]CAG35807.1 unknown protein [Desulfotalea psychrophila LSv54]